MTIFKICCGRNVNALSSLRSKKLLSESSLVQVFWLLPLVQKLQTYHDVINFDKSRIPAYQYVDFFVISRPINCITMTVMHVDSKR